MLTFPLSKDEAGRNAWMLLHHRASLYSDSPSDKEKQRMKTFLYETFQSVSLLCDNCKKHIHDYLKSHPLAPALVSKRAISKYLCEFHNHVNERTGKEIHNCHIILGKKPECKDCQVEVKKDTNELRDSFEKFKDASVTIFFKLCDRYKIPYPTIKFNGCPSDTESSCTSMWIDQRTNDIVEKPIVYLHPNLYGLRTIVHEFMHYIKTLSKDTIGSIDEESVERDAQSILRAEFPYDTLGEEDLKTTRLAPTTVSNLVVKKDVVASKLALFPNSYKIYEKHLKNVKRRDFAPATTEQGDWIFDLLGGVTQGKDEGVDIEQVESKQERHNHTLSFLDGIYAPFASLFGIQASDMNRNNTPDIISNAAIALMRSNLSSIGSLLLTTLTSVGIYGALALGKNSLSYGDKLLMNSFGSQLLWSGIEYARPDSKEEVFNEAVMLGEAFSNHQYGMIPKIFFGDTFLGSMVGETSTASPLSAARNLQRSSISSAGGGSIGGGGGSSSRTAADIRNLQRTGAEWSYAPAGTPSTQDVYTRAARGGNPAYTGRGPVGRNAVYAYDDAVVIPSEEEEYESAFGARVSDGSNRDYGAAFVDVNDDVTTRRNTIKDVFENDPYYDNFYDEYAEEGGY